MGCAAPVAANRQQRRQHMLLNTASRATTSWGTALASPGRATRMGSAVCRTSPATTTDVGVWSRLCHALMMCDSVKASKSVLVSMCGLETSATFWQAVSKHSSRDKSRGVATELLTSTETHEHVSPDAHAEQYGRRVGHHQQDGVDHVLGVVYVQDPDRSVLGANGLQ